MCLGWRVEMYGSLCYVGTWNFLLFQSNGPLCLANTDLAIFAKLIGQVGISLGNQPRGWAVPFCFFLLHIWNWDADWVNKLRIGSSCWLKSPDSHCVMRSWCVAQVKTWPGKMDSEKGVKQMDRERKAWESMWPGREEERNMCLSFWPWSLGTRCTSCSWVKGEIFQSYPTHFIILLMLVWAVGFCSLKALNILKIQVVLRSGKLDTINMHDISWLTKKGTSDWWWRLNALFPHSKHLGQMATTNLFFL